MPLISLSQRESSVSSMPGKQQHLATKLSSLPNKQPFLFCFLAPGGKDNGQVNQRRLTCPGGVETADSHGLSEWSPRGQRPGQSGCMESAILINPWGCLIVFALVFQKVWRREGVEEGRVLPREQTFQCNHHPPPPQC